MNSPPCACWVLWGTAVLREFCLQPSWPMRWAFHACGWGGGHKAHKSDTFLLLTQFLSLLTICSSTVGHCGPCETVMATLPGSTLGSFTWHTRRAHGLRVRVRWGCQFCHAESENCVRGERGRECETGAVTSSKVNTGMYCDSSKSLLKFVDFCILMQQYCRDRTLTFI